MALAEPLFTSQLYRENANVDTYMPLAFPNLFHRFLGPSAGSFRLHLTSRSPSSSARNFIHKVFHGEIPRLIGRDYIFPLRLCSRSIRPAASFSCLTSGTDYWNFRILVRSLNLNFAKITGEIAYVTSHISKYATVSDCLWPCILMDT